MATFSSPLEIHIAVRNELDKTQDFQYADFQPEQIDYWINKAYELWIDETAYPMAQQKLPFEYNQKRIDELRELVKSDEGTATQNLSEFVIKLPNDYRHLVRHECVTKLNDITKTVPGVQTKLDYINLQKKDPFWIPTNNNPLFYITGDSIVYETKGDFDVVSNKIQYIKNPIHLKLGSEYTDPEEDVYWEITNQFAIYQIINRCVQMMLENIESPRYQTNLNEYNKTN